MTVLTWGPGYDINLLVTEMERLRSPTSGTFILVDSDCPGVTFHSSLKDLIPIVRAALVVPQHLSEDEVEDVVRKGIFRAAKRGPLGSGTLLDCIRTVYHRRMKVPPQDFHVVGSLTVSSSSTLAGRRINGSTISFFNTRPASYNRKPVQWLIDANCHDSPSDQLTVVITCSGRTAEGALGKALRELDFLRGLWCFHNTFNRGTVESTSYRPLNPIRFGPVATIHKPNGELALKAPLCGQHFKDVLPLTVVDEANLYRRHERKIRARIKSSVDRVPIESYLVAYARALDDQDPHACFLGLWHVLEQATGGLQKSYDYNIRRAVVCAARFRSGQRRLLTQILEYLRMYRNRLVHDSYGSSQTYFVMQQLKFVVEAVLAFVLDFIHILKSMDCVHKFLDTLEQVNIEKDVDIRRCLNIQVSP